MPILGSGWIYFRLYGGTTEMDVYGGGIYFRLYGGTTEMDVYGGGIYSFEDGSGWGDGGIGADDVSTPRYGLDVSGKGTGFGQRRYGFQKEMYVRQPDGLWRKL